MGFGPMNLVFERMKTVLTSYRQATVIDPSGCIGDVIVTERKSYVGLHSFLPSLFLVPD